MDFIGFLRPGAPPEAIEEILSHIPGDLHADARPVSGRSAAALAPPTAVHCEEGIIALVSGDIRWSNQAPSEVLGCPSAPGALWHAYRALGPRLCGLLGGHFAFAVVDTARQTVLLAVDRIGTRPVYFTIPPTGGIAFGSRSHAVAAAGGIGERLSDQALYEYLYFHMIPAPDSVREGVSKLPPASCLILEQGQARQLDYWTPAFSDRGNLDELSEELLATLEACVADASAADPQAGAFLSGGLDSSTVAGMLVRAAGPGARTYSIGFDAEGYDETAYARIAAQQFGTDQHEYYVTPDDVVDSVPKIAGALDEPFGNSSVVPTYFCAKLAAQDGRGLLLAGDGGDELFAGNERYRKQLIFEVYAKLPGPLRHGLLEPLLDRVEVLRRLPLMAKAKSYIDQARIPLPDRFQTYNYLHRYTPAEVFTADFLDGVDTDRPLTLLRERYGALGDSVDPIDRMLFLDWKFTLADNDLRKVSSMCALGGVEVIYPMLDDRLIDLSCRVPPQAKLDRLELRRFYRRAMNGFLPGAILEKRKHGFGLPFGVWMREHPPLRQLAYDSLGALKARGIIDPGFIDQAITMHANSHAAYFGELVWVLMMLEMWVGHPS